MHVLSKEEEKSSHILTPFLFKHGASVTDIDKDIWLAFKQGSRRALDYIFEKYVRLLYAYGGKISKDQALVEDCIQDLFIELWTKRENLSETDNIKFYLMKSLRRKIVRKITEDHRIQTEPLQGDDYTVDLEFSVEFHIIQEQSSLEQREQLTKALKQLSKRQREAIYLKFYEKLRYEEIAEMMNLSVKSTYNLIGKAIDTLRKIIKITF